MAHQPGDSVCVMRSVLGLGEAPQPFYKTRIVDVVPHGVTVSMPDGTASHRIPSAKVEIGYGVLIIRVGDYDGSSPLDPLARSLKDYSSMILPGDNTRLLELRTLEEFEKLWAIYHAAYHQVILVSHGDENCMVFGDNEVTASDLVEVLNAQPTTPKEFIGLGCNTGDAAFARVFSSATCVSRFMASYHTVSPCTASVFVQTYLHERLIAVRTPNVAFRNARSDLYSAASYRKWVGGRLIN